MVKSFENPKKFKDVAAESVLKSAYNAYKKTAEDALSFDQWREQLLKEYELNLMRGNHHPTIKDFLKGKDSHQINLYI